MDLNEIQKRVKRLDYEVVRILNQRMELALRASRLREGPVDDAEEKIVFDHIGQIPERLVGKPFVRELFNAVSTESLRLRLLDRKLVGFQGEHGANSDVAVRAVFPQLLPIPCMKFIDVFEGVKNGWFDYGLVPVENSLEPGIQNKGKHFFITHDIRSERITTTDQAVFQALDKFSDLVIFLEQLAGDYPPVYQVYLFVPDHGPAIFYGELLGTPDHCPVAFPGEVISQKLKLRKGGNILPVHNGNNGLFGQVSGIGPVFGIAK